MWVLCCYLPLMIGEMVYENDSYWCNFISLLEISRYLFGPKLDEDDLAVLNVLITEHHRRFRILSLTLATRHQNLQYYLIKENAFLSETLECGPGEISCALNRISYTYSHALNDCDSNCFLFFFVECLPSEIYLFI